MHKTRLKHCVVLLYGLVMLNILMITHILWKRLHILLWVCQIPNPVGFSFLDDQI